MNTLATHIVPATEKDVAIIKATGVKTFTDSFAWANTIEDMAVYLAQSFNEEQLLRELQNPEIKYYIAYSGTHAVGYLKLNLRDAQNEEYGNDFVEIERIYVLKEFQNRAIGQELLEKAVSVAKQQQAKWLWLGVWGRNPGAIKFYRRNGFVEYGSHPFLLGNDLQTDILMKLEL